jgi:hypothetical protein
MPWVWPQPALKKENMTQASRVIDIDKVIGEWSVIGGVLNYRIF